MAATLILAAGAGCQRPEAELTIDRAYAYALPSASEVAVYFVMTNPADRPDTVIHVNAVEAAGAMFHRNVTEGALVRMEHLSELVVGARDSVVLAPGGIHLMLTDVRPVSRGDTLRLSIELAHAGNRQVAVPVLEPGDPPPGQE
jgi:copper(I)-binding protein